MAMENFNKENIANVYLFAGEENYKKRIYRDQLRKIITSGNDMNYSYFEGKSIDFGKVYDSAVTLPFFAEKRMVVVENSGIFAAKKKGGDSEESSASESSTADSSGKNDRIIEKILTELPVTTVLVFLENSAAKNKRIYKLVTEKGSVIECNPDTEEEVIKWLAKGFNQAGKKVRKSTIMLLLDRVGLDYDRLRQEFEKIVSYSGDRAEICDEDVLAVTMADIESKIFDMLSAIGQKDVKKVLDKYYDLLSNHEHPLYILAMIRLQFRTLLQTAELRNKGYTTSAVARMLKKRDFAIANAEKYLKGYFKMKDVRNILEEISEMDKKMKNGEIGEQIGVEMLLIKFSM